MLPGGACTSCSVTPPLVAGGGGLVAIGAGVGWGGGVGCGEGSQAATRRADSSSSLSSSVANRDVTLSFKGGAQIRSVRTILMAEALLSIVIFVATPLLSSYLYLLRS